LGARRERFVVITIAVFFIFQLMAFNLAFTYGNGGVSTPFASWDPATYNNPYYYAALVIAVGAIALSWLIRGSRFGLQLLAIRDDEDRARGLGVRAMRVKLAAFVLSAFVTGVVGGLWVLFIGQALPETAFNPAYDLSVALMGFLGGFGALVGPGARRAHARAAAAGDHPAVHQRLRGRDRARRPVPPGDPVPAARAAADGAGVGHQAGRVAGPARPAPPGQRNGSAGPGRG